MEIVARKNKQACNVSQSSCKLLRIGVVDFSKVINDRASDRISFVCTTILTFPSTLLEICEGSCLCTEEDTRRDYSVMYNLMLL